MSKKLLEESTIRSFMKLANLQPLTAKFLSESADEDKDDKDDVKEEVQEEGEALEEVELEEEEGDALEEVVAEEGEVKEEAKDAAEHSAPKTSPKDSAAKGKSLTGKPSTTFKGAESVKSPGKIKPAKETSKHSVSSGPVKVSHETGPKSSGSKDRVGGKSRGEFEIKENVELEEQELETEGSETWSEEMTASDEAGETGDHQEKVKGVIQGILSQLQTLAGDYGIEMAVDSEEEGGEEGEELPGEPEEAGEAGEMESPEEETAEEPEGEKLQEALNVLTKRVAARLVKESKKKR